MEKHEEWIEACRGPLGSIRELPGGAGRRRYWRATHRDGSSSILMHAESEDPKILPPALREASLGKSGAARVHECSFVQITRLLEAHGIPVPELYALNDEHAWILLEDLGDRHLLDLDPAERRERCGELLEILARVHAIERNGALPFERRFDEEWIAFELRLFLDCVPAGALREDLRRELTTLAREVAELPQVLSLRDLQSQNVLIDARGALRLIDYQDALLAPRELDLAALLLDSYVEPHEAAARDALLAHYAAAAQVDLDAEAFAMLAVQRKCKDLSRFRSLVHAGRGDDYSRPLARANAAIRAACPGLPAPLESLARLLPRALDEIAT